MKKYINLAKKHKLFIFLSMPALLIWMALGCMHSNFNSLNVSLIAQIVEWPINVINILLITFIIKQSRNKTETMGLLTSIALLFFGRYYIFYSLFFAAKNTIRLSL
jgi:cytochrome bd-type quinol oxidase subunit 2